VEAVARSELERQGGQLPTQKGIRPYLLCVYQREGNLSFKSWLRED